MEFSTFVFTNRKYLAMKKLLLCFSLFTFYFSFTSTAQWVSGGTQVSFNVDTAYNHHRPFLSATPHGGFYVTWQTTDTTTNQYNKIRTAAYDSNGNELSGWASGGILASPTGDHYASQIITSEDGGAIVAWYGYPIGSNVSSIFVQKYSTAGTALWNSGNPVQVSSGGSGYQHKYPLIVSDKKNGVLLAWTRWDSIIDFSSQDVMMQHIDMNGNVAAGWNSAGTGVAVNAGVAEYYPQIALTPDSSSVYVVWANGPIGGTSLFLNKFNESNGALATGWTTAGNLLTSGPDVYPLINHDLWLYADSSNNAVVFWIESRVSANGECYMQQISPSGTQLLATFGTIVAGYNPNGIDYLEVKQEADMNFLVAYNNLDVNNDVAALKVTPGGNFIWKDTMITNNGNSAYPFPASDGNKGMYLFYVNTNSPEKMYALGLDSTGKLYNSWALPGVGFGDINNYDGFNPNYDQNAVGTNKGAAVVAWNKIYSGFYNIFTCNIHADKTTCSSPNAIVEINAPSDGYVVYPNPSDNRITLSGTYEGNKQITIYNVIGQTLAQLTHQGLEAILDISELSSGMYLISVNEINTGKKTILKFVKK